MKNKKILIIIFIILSIVLLILNITKYFCKKEETKYSTDVEKMVMPSGSLNLIRNYNGDNKITYVYNGLYHLSTYIPNLQTELKNEEEEKIKKYFNRKKEYILQMTGIDNEDDFKKLVDYINNFESVDKLKNAEILEESFKNVPSNLEFQIKLNYENGESMNFKCNFKNRIDSNDNNVKFSVI